jgi:hypothetical protein
MRTLSLLSLLALAACADERGTLTVPERTFTDPGVTVDTDVSGGDTDEVVVPADTDEVPSTDSASVTDTGGVGPRIESDLEVLPEEGIDFSLVGIGCTTAPRVFTITNLNTTTVTAHFETNGVYPNTFYYFSVQGVEWTNTGEAFVTLAPGETVPVQVSFHPEVGMHWSYPNLRISTENGPSIHQVWIQGKGHADMACPR